MKNQTLTPYLLPTEDASFLEMYDILSVCQFDNTPLKSHSGKNHHIYLCSSESIKEGNWVFNVRTQKVYCANSGLKEYLNPDLRKILFTTDPRLIADGVLPIDGNTKAMIVGESDSKWWNNSCEVSFLTEFCKRYNNKDKGVDVEKLAEEKYKHLYGSDYVDKIEGFKEGYNQAQQNTGRFSLEDMGKFAEWTQENLYVLDREDDPHKWMLYPSQPAIYKTTKELLNEYIQSLTRQPKEDIVISVEVEEGNDYSTQGITDKWSKNKRIKLNSNGQATLTFKQ